MYWPCPTVEEGDRRRREEAERKRQAVAAAAKLHAEEDECFRLISSAREGDRLEGYRRHLSLLAQRNRTTIRHHASDGGHAYWYSRTYYAPYPSDEAKAAVGYHERAHIIEGSCPNDGTVHRRDPGVREWSNCVACETAATRRALSLAPFTRGMFDRLARGLRSYSPVHASACAGTREARSTRRHDQLQGASAPLARMV